MGRRFEELARVSWASARGWLPRLARRRVLAILAALMVASGVVYGAAAVVGSFEDLEKANKALQQALENIDPGLLANTWLDERFRCTVYGIVHTGECARPPDLLRPTALRPAPLVERIDLDDPRCRAYRERLEPCPYPLRDPPPYKVLHDDPQLCLAYSELDRRMGRCPHKIVARDRITLLDPRCKSLVGCPYPLLAPPEELAQPLRDDLLLCLPLESLLGGAPCPYKIVGIPLAERLAPPGERLAPSGRPQVQRPPPERDSLRHSWHQAKSYYFATRNTVLAVWAQDWLTRGVLFGSFALAALTVAATAAS